MVLILKYIDTFKHGFAATWTQQARQRRDCSGLAGSIVAKQGKDLPRVHGHGGTFHSYLAIVVDFAEASHTQTVRFPLDLRRHILKVLPAHPLVVLLLITNFYFLRRKSRASLGEVEARKIPGLSHAIFFWHHLVKVVAEKAKHDNIKCQHEETFVKCDTMHRHVGELCG